MWFVLIGVAMVVLNVAGIGPLGEWTWTWGGKAWFILVPFVLAVAWWGWSDASGRTQRKAMEKVDAKREARRQKALDALGMQKSGRRR